MNLENPFDVLDQRGVQLLARKYGSPFYLYHADAIDEQVCQIRELFQGTVKIYYAVKANPNLQLLRSVRESIDGLDISSGGEMKQALLAGFSSSQLSFAGPAKTVEELEHAIDSSVGSISVESDRELIDIIRLCRSKHVRANVIVRVNPKLAVREFALKMGGKAIQFGIDEEHLPATARIIQDNESELNFRGIHVYTGSQCFDANAIQQGVDDTFRIASELEEISDLRCEVVNLGGGFGVSHTDKSKSLDIGALAEQMAPTIRVFQDSATFSRDLIFELGRYLTARAGIYVTTVISSKKSRGKDFYMLDGGLNHNLAAAGTFGSVLRSNFMVRNLSRPDATPVRCTLAGPSCNPTDLLAINVELPKPELGDLIGVLNSGSYGLTASPILFLGRNTPAEIVYHNGEFRLGRAPHAMTSFN